MAIALNHSRATGTAKVVLLGIANHDGDGGAWPSVATLARYANVDARTVQRALDRLEQLGEVRRLAQAGGTDETPNHLRPNRYRVLVACPSHCDRTSQHRDARKPLIPVSDEVSEGVTPVSPGDASVRGGVTPVSPKPSFNQTTRLKEETQVNAHARNKEECPSGHPMVDGYCLYACKADLARREAEAQKLVSA